MIQKNDCVMHVMIAHSKGMSWIMEEYFVDEAYHLDAHEMGLADVGCFEDDVE